MSTRTLAKTDWHAYCDSLSKALAGQRAHIEVGGLRLGSQVAVKSLPLYGITYEPKGETLEIAMEGVDHIIRNPKAILVDDGVGGLRTMEIVDAEDEKQIMQLVEPLMLTAAA